MHAIHVAPGRRLPTKSVDSVEAEAGVGLVGDRYHGSKHRHVTVQAIDDLDAAAEVLGRPIDPGLTRRNITLDHGPIPTRPGERMRIADVESRLSASPRPAGCSTTGWVRARCRHCARRAAAPCSGCSARGPSGSATKP